MSHGWNKQGPGTSAVPQQQANPLRTASACGVGARCGVQNSVAELWNVPRAHLATGQAQATPPLPAGNLPKAYQIMRNDATWKMNRYLCSVKIHVTMGVSPSQTLMQIRNIAKPRNVHEKFIGAIAA